MTPAVTSAASVATIDTAVSDIDSRTMQNTAAAEAPELIPMMSGLASGLRSIVWKVMPAIPNAAPARAPTSARGSRSTLTVNEAPGTCSPRSTRMTSAGLNVCRPNRSDTATVTRMRTASTAHTSRYLRRRARRPALTCAMTEATGGVEAAPASGAPGRATTRPPRVRFTGHAPSCDGRRR